MDPVRGAELPQAGVGLVVHVQGELADLLERMEILLGRLAQQPLVVEGLGDGQDDLAVDVVLEV